jgi:ubiquinol-cytochrome c reductase cytochrome c subunit
VLVLAPLLLVLATPWLAADRPAGAQGGPEAGAEAETEAEQTYLADCASCHGADGRGTNRGPTLVDVGKASTYYYLSTGRMPIDEPDARSTRKPPGYSPEVIDALVEYVDDLAGGGPGVPELHPKSAEVARGGRLYRAQCASCHTTAGGGGALLRQEAPSVYHATPAETAAAIRVGPGTMPAFGEAALNDEELNDVVAYVEYLASPEDRGGQSLWHLGPLIEGLVGWVVGLGLLVLLALWIGKPT